MARGQPGTVRRVVSTPRKAALGGQHDRLGNVGRAAGEPAPDDLLGPSVAVHIGRIYEGAAGLEEPVDLLVRARLVGLHPERHRAQAQARHRATASSQSSIVHTARLPGGVIDIRGHAVKLTAVSQADAAVHDYVDVLRSRGISWTRIGAALGVSKQAAWERFSGED